MNRKTYFIIPLGLLFFNFIFNLSFSQVDSKIYADDQFDQESLANFLTSSDNSDDALIAKLLEETLELEQIIDSIEIVNLPLTEKPLDSYTEENIIELSINNQIIMACREEILKNSKLIEYKLKDRNRRKRR